MAGIAVLGIANSSYLAWTAILGEAPTCLLNSGCDVVAASAYSRVFGIPLAMFGVFFYTMIAGFALWGALLKNSPAIRYILPLSGLGFLLSLYFLYLQAFVILAFCEYCLFSLFDATVLFTLSISVWLKQKNQDTLQNTETYGSM